jgi:Kef-type K+ transport system membrane component KefB
MQLDAFGQLGLIIVIAGVIALIMRLLKQPLIMGYILTGILIGPLGFISDSQTFEIFSEIGIALLLFIIGLELNVAVIKKLGKAVFATAAALFITVGTIGYLIAIAFHYTQNEALIIGLALFFSSTIIIAKMLSDKRELSRLNGQIAIGIILLDDIVATIALLFVATSGHHLQPLDIIWLIARGLGLLALLVFCAKVVLPRITRYVAKSQELLFLFAIAWGFGIANLFHAAGFSIEVGALFAGVSMAQLTYTQEIGARLKPLRDFFVVLFFISLGTSLEMNNLISALLPALVFSIVVIVIKPLVVMTSLAFMGYTKRTVFKTGINLSQISEFSIVLVVLAHSTGLVGDTISAIITVVAIISIATSTYMMQYDNWLYAKLERHLHLFERSLVNEKQQNHRRYPLVMFGYKKGGHEFIKTFRELKQKFVVIDYDPDVIETLARQRINFLYGDANDVELLEELDIKEIQLAVVTITDENTNLAIVKYIMHHNQRAVVVCQADDYNSAAKLYQAGAAYVILPHFIGNERISTYIHKNGITPTLFDSYRSKHMREIGDIALRKT